MKRLYHALILAGLTLLLSAKTKRRQIKTLRILRVDRVVADLDRAEKFYSSALKFETVERGRLDQAALAALGFSDTGATAVVMRLGSEKIALVQFDVRGALYPPNSKSNDLWFQHMAIVVSNMDAAYAHLSAYSGWHPISQNGPQLLPPSNGAVRAFKFRDPDGHPLELISFPPGSGRPVWQQNTAGILFLGIDHTAISISSGHRSLRFYRNLGFVVRSRSSNHGPAQAELDGLPNAQADVIGLRPASPAGPGIELLCYQPAGRLQRATSPNDGMVDWITLEIDGPLNMPFLMRDPDGHLLMAVNRVTDWAVS